MKRTTFSFASVPPYDADPVAVATLTFTPPITGTAVLTARGYCNMQIVVNTDNTVTLAIAPTLESAFAGSVPEWGVVTVPFNAPFGLYQPGWTAQTTQSVVAGESYSMVLAARHEVGEEFSDCSGSFMVEIFTEVME